MADSEITTRINEWKKSSQSRMEWYDKNHDPQYDSLVAVILSDKDLTALARAGDDAGCAAGLPPRKSSIPTYVTRKGLAKIIGEIPTATVMATLRAASVPADNTMPSLIAAEVAIGRLEMLAVRGGSEKEGIDLSDSMTQGLIEELAGGDNPILSQDHKAALIAACTQTTPVTANEVSAAMLQFRFDGKCKEELP